MKNFFKKNKVLKILIIFIFFLLVAIFGYEDKSKKTEWLKNNLNQDFKNFLNKTLFYPLYLKKKVKFSNSKILANQKKFEKMIFKIFENGFEINKVNQQNISINNNYLNYFKWDMPFFEEGIYGAKPVFYIDNNKNDIFLISGAGLLFKFNSEDLDKDQIKLFNIKTNLIEIINDEQFYHNPYLSIKDIFIDNNYIFLSYSKKSKDNCYNTSILRGEINESNIKFNIFFDPDECSQKNPTSGGGRIVKFNNDNIFFTIGDFFDWKKPQNKKSIFGKIILLNLKNKKYKTVSMGHRNQQGLTFLKNKNVLIETEHGPKGGDEVNLIDLSKNQEINNFGWPISSYGVHYDGKKSKIAPLHKSHKDHGFIEPILHFTPSIGISEIRNVDIFFNEDKNYNHFFVSALGHKDQIDEGDQSLHLIKLDSESLKLDTSNIEKIILNERVRDMHLMGNELILALESTPSIGLINKNY